MVGKYWFTPKTYGRGFVPISWEGWVFTLFLLVLIGVAMIRNGLWLPGFPLEYDVNALQIVSFVFDVVLLVFAVLWFMEKKCDGELQRRRGQSKPAGTRVKVESGKNIAIGSKIAASSSSSQGRSASRKS